MPAKVDPLEYREAVTVRIKRRKLEKINRYCARNHVARSELLAGFISDRVDELGITEE